MPFKPPARRFEQSIILQIKSEIENLSRARFIRAARYVDWLSNLVPVRKKNEKVKICVDLRNLNTTIPKNEYPMPIANMLVDASLGHKILSFMDGHAGYNQIMIAEEDVSKATFRCVIPQGRNCNPGSPTNPPPIREAPHRRSVQTDKDSTNNYTNIRAENKSC